MQVHPQLLDLPRSTCSITHMYKMKSLLRYQIFRGLAIAHTSSPSSTEHTGLGPGQLLFQDTESELKSKKVTEGSVPAQHGGTPAGSFLKWEAGTEPAGPTHS